jgi:hypothetical protein
MSPLWIIFLLTVTAVPRVQHQPAERKIVAPISSASAGREPLLHS